MFNSASVFARRQFHSGMNEGVISDSFLLMWEVHCFFAVEGSLSALLESTRKARNISLSKEVGQISLHPFNFHGIFMQSIQHISKPV